MFACGALFVVAPMVGWWLPERKSDHAWDIDFLFYVILAITGFFFVLTEALLVVFMFRYCQSEPGEVRKPSLWLKVYSPFAGLLKPFTSLLNTASRVEMAWTIVPAVILLYIAFAQVDTWADVKYKTRLDKYVLDKQDSWDGLKYVSRPDKSGGPKGTGTVVQIGVSARQFEWKMRYPSPATWKSWKEKPELAAKWANNLTGEFDDIYLTNELHIINERHVVVNLSTKDVIHSFNLPHMRVKQDALPGKVIPVWFKPIDYNVVPIAKNGKKSWEYRDGINADTGKPKNPDYVWEIACAELCGWGHYRMIGRALVHKDEGDFESWLETAAAQQNDFGPNAMTVPKK